MNISDALGPLGLRGPNIYDDMSPEQLKNEVFRLSNENRTLRKSYSRAIKPPYNKDCLTCKHEPEFIDYGDAMAGRCGKRNIYVVRCVHRLANGAIERQILEEARHGSERKQLINCPKHKAVPKKCTCSAEGPVHIIPLNRAWDNGGWWVRVLCADCLRAAEEGTSSEEAVDNWNNDYLVEKSG